MLYERRSRPTRRLLPSRKLLGKQRAGDAGQEPSGNRYPSTSPKRAVQDEYQTSIKQRLAVVLVNERLSQLLPTIPLSAQVSAFPQCFRTPPLYDPAPRYCQTCRTRPLAGCLIRDSRKLVLNIVPADTTFNSARTSGNFRVLCAAVLFPVHVLVYKCV